MKFYWVDAFTDKKLGGNPCAVILDADDLSASDMQQIALEMNLSETAFIMKSKKADFRARYFTKSYEIPLAGHPTISSIKALIHEGRINPETQKNVTLELAAGVINISIGHSGLISMEQCKPEFLATHDKEKIAEMFSLHINDLHATAPVQTVSTGSPQLMVLLKNNEILRKATLREELYIPYQKQSDFLSPHLFCLEGHTAEGQTSARHLGVPPEPLEDPFTGSATGGMACFLWHHGLIESPKFMAQQGHPLNRPGKASIEVIGPPTDISTVTVAGEAVILIAGNFLWGD